MTTAEEIRLAQDQNRTVYWKRWGPYLSERQWGTVREDYPHRGISQDKLPLYLGFFEFVHNLRARGKNLLPSLLECLLA